MGKFYEMGNNTTSLELLWNQALEQLNAWTNGEEYREEMLLKSASQYAENVKRNQNNIKQLTEQFFKELSDWEKSAREQLLTTMTGMQYLFPLKSFEEINTQLDDVQNKTTKVTLTPMNHLLNDDQVDKFVNALEQYVKFRRNNRNLYVSNLKKTTSVVQENQTAFFKIMTDQVKNVFFPFQKYMVNSEETENVK
jgi:hypothetical protein